ncbi:MAG: stage II sporulation protein M [Candidatus Pacebacteria bacterium]|nr:stage II sporulation protein M [Candidatus Paceibacterota bacterium]MDD3072232.1 stage II sporulation protein M [Candidatus Paceibacterota bacterium]MDD3729059.1 stage II sporulation protein M [Candidatus Paceibacterota bacterium]MDD4201189.1 stage II sporulation protein M [Candidatus Paceibacterota bacterium]MDD4467312.1 stage II sporulation protein M [Candidatus Paceibacterota bacterium]
MNLDRKINYKEYFFSLKPFLGFSFLIFFFSFINGYFLGEKVFDKDGMFLEELRKIASSLVNMGNIELFFFIFINNTVSLFLTVFLGMLFSIFPFFVLLVNGGILGILFFFFLQNSNLSLFLLGILPHGIIEIPILIIGGAMGFKMGKTMISVLFKKKGDLREEISLSFVFFARFLFPLIAIAALVEVFITGSILDIMK